jgi:hypothetical protein
VQEEDLWAELTAAPKKAKRFAAARRLSAKLRRKEGASGYGSLAAAVSCVWGRSVSDAWVQWSAPCLLGPASPCTSRVFQSCGEAVPASSLLSCSSLHAACDSPPPTSSPFTSTFTRVALPRMQSPHGEQNQIWMSFFQPCTGTTAGRVSLPL